ncbi:P-loop containing nucleoside triphosphate hydrolase protein [Flagelloscypha sp. PMI_526]|nr:P-loop containing nucleoside triphosphate hydrolase protein [Flagelloscypha sp. PMI_526]
MSGNRRKLVIVGDSGVGKTTLLSGFYEGIREKLVPETVVNIQVDKNMVELVLCDTTSQNEYGDGCLRPLSYVGAHVILIAFSVDRPASLVNAQEKWVSEIRHFLSRVHIILVACKKDLRIDQLTLKTLHKTDQQPVSSADGKAVSLKIGAIKYLECSSKSGEGVNQMLQTAASISMKEIKRTNRSEGSCVVY